jgi:hypothetical protein
MLAASRSLSLLSGFAGALIWFGAAFGQVQPLPLPSLPGTGAPPIYTQPSPTAPKAPGSEPRAPEPPRTLEPVGRGGELIEPPRRRGPEITSFPELIRGAGNSETLLQGVDAGSTRR